MKVYKTSTEKMQRSYVYDAKFEEKPISFKNDKNFGDFDQSTQKSPKFVL